jgi:RNA ligase (TIGR02306 family)
MTEFNVEVVRLDGVEKHPNADTLSVTHIHGGYPVVFKTGSHKIGEQVVYIPIDALVPLADPRFSFLSDKAIGKPFHRIRAKKLRGIFSMGMLIPAQNEWEVGQNVQELLGIQKWEPRLLKGRNISAYSEQVSDPGVIPVYTDLESLRKYGHVLNEGEDVVITEKIHGSNIRYVYALGELWAGSHKTFKRRDIRNLWWHLAAKYGIEEKLLQFPDVAIYAEAYGQIQDLRYGTGVDEVKLAAFDIYDCKQKKYLDYDDFISMCKRLDIPTVPVLFRGPWHDDLRGLAEGKSTLANHVREGFVVRPIKERWDEQVGRVAFKLVGQGYLLRKEDQ